MLPTSQSAHWQMAQLVSIIRQRKSSGEGERKRKSSGEGERKHKRNHAGKWSTVSDWVVEDQSIEDQSIEDRLKAKFEVTFNNSPRPRQPKIREKARRGWR